MDVEQPPPKENEKPIEIVKRIETEKDCDFFFKKKRKQFKITLSIQLNYCSSISFKLSFHFFFSSLSGF